MTVSLTLVSILLISPSNRCARSVWTVRKASSKTYGDTKTGNVTPRSLRLLVVPSVAAKAVKVPVLTVGIVVAVTGLPVDPRTTLIGVGALTVPVEPPRLKRIVCGVCVLRKDDVGNVASSGSKTRASKECENGGSCSLDTIPDNSE